MPTSISGQKKNVWPFNSKTPKLAAHGRNSSERDLSDFQVRACYLVLDMSRARS